MHDSVLFTVVAQTTPQLAEFVTHPTENQEAKSGDTVSLNCSVNAGEIVHWLFNDTLIPASNTAYTISGGELTIGSFQFNLAGAYRCVASRDGGKTLQVSHAGRVWYLGKIRTRRGHAGRH